MLRSPFRPEPPHRHGLPQRTAVLLCNLGTPEAPTTSAVRRYLAEFLSDARVVEIPRLIWLAILHGIVLRVRPAASAAKYATVWLPEGSPLKIWTERQAQALQQRFAAQGHDVVVHPAMRYGQPAIAATLDALKAAGCTRVLVLPAYPQYSGTTTASVMDAVFRWGLQTRRLPELRLVQHYHDHPAYIRALAEQVRQHWATQGRADKLLMSFHGVPERTLHLGDPYHCACHKTARLLAEALGLSNDDYLVTFQSRFGKAKWLEPYTEPSLVALAQNGLRSVDVICPGFVSDCLETLEEIAQEAQHAFLQAGGERFSYIPCLNDSPAWIDALHEISLQHLHGWPLHVDTDEERQASLARAQAQGARN